MTLGLMEARNKMRGFLKIAGYIILFGFIIYNSVYFKSLEEYHSKVKVEEFDAVSYSRDFIDNRIETIPAIAINQLFDSLDTNFENYVSGSGSKLGISHDYYFMVSGSGEVESILEENIAIIVENDKKIDVATSFIYGNAVREASGMAHIGDFKKTMDFNTISIELNRIIQSDIIDPILSNIQEGDILQFKGALKINDEDVEYGKLRIVPIRLSIRNDKN